MKIIVLCTGNSCRSQIAEGLLKSKFPAYEIHSAGTKPEINVNPYAIRAMKEINIDISDNYPKLVDDFVDQDFDYVLTVCDSANFHTFEELPKFEEDESIEKSTS